MGVRLNPEGNAYNFVLGRLKEDFLVGKAKTMKWTKGIGTNYDKLYVWNLFSFFEHKLRTKIKFHKKSLIKQDL